MDANVEVNGAANVLPDDILNELLELDLHPEQNNDVEMLEEMQIPWDVGGVVQAIFRWKNVLENAFQLNDVASIQQSHRLIVMALDRTITFGIPEKLSEWNVHQKTVGLKCQDDGGLYTEQRQRLNDIQTLLESLAENIKLIHRMMSRFHDVNLNDMLLCRMVKIISTAFIVVDQPPQVCFKDRRFDVSLRLLMPNAIAATRNVTVNILTEEEARNQRLDLLNPWKTPQHVFSDFFTTENEPNWSQSQDGTVCNIKCIRYTRILPRGVNPVPETKYFLLFSTAATLFNGSVVQICALSLPIVFITNNCQEVDAYATIMWNNLLSETDHSAVEWTRIETALKVFFKGYTKGCLLNTDHLSYLRNRAFQIEPDPNQMRTFKQLCRLEITQRSGERSSFWKYFYEAAKLTRSFSGHWKNNYIHGFIIRSLAEHRLLQCEPGTFLLRFPDSACGKITIARCISEGGRRQVAMVRPYERREFNPDFDTIIMQKTDLVKLLDVNGNLHAKGDVFHENNAVIRHTGYEPR